MDLELQNLREIELLNQRGGRTLSVVDLIRAGTLDLRMAACAMRAMAEGASLLTGARPGGVGKTTLMAALLGLLPPGEPIRTVDDPDVLVRARRRAPDQPACYLVHEIGAGHWYGYLWGAAVADFLALAERRRRIASCLHADTLDELRHILCSPPLNVDAASLGRIGLVLFIHARPGRGGWIRRVAAYWEADGAGGHRLLFRWRPRQDAFEQTGELHDPAALRPYQAFLERLVEAGVVEFAEVRRRVLDFYA